MSEYNVKFMGKGGRDKCGNLRILRLYKLTTLVLLYYEEALIF
jgi:hypothetical protein